MVAYSFKKQFIGPIKVGLGIHHPGEFAPYQTPAPKRQTIRADRKRHARPGEELQLYSGMRTRGCFLIGKARCISVDQIDIAFRARQRSDFVRIASMSHKIDRPYDLDVFAKSDGFHSWDEMRAFWREQHSGVDDFRGVLIRWKPILT